MLLLSCDFVASRSGFKGPSASKESSMARPNVVDRYNMLCIARGGGNNNPQTNENATGNEEEMLGGSSKSQVIEIYENEYFDTDRKAWIGGSPLPQQMPVDTSSTSSSSSSSINSNLQYKQLPRWTAMSSEDGDATIPMVPPPEVIAPSGYNFTSDWKIDLAGDRRDEYGWEYVMEYATVEEGEELPLPLPSMNDNSHSLAVGRRRRRWLRQVDRVNIAQGNEGHMSITNTSKTRKSKKGKPLSSSFQPQPSFVQRKKKSYLSKSNPLLQSLASSFSYQGYGVSIFKSLMHLTSCGIAWRMPVTGHFPYFDKRPYLPLISTTIGLYYPKLNGACNLNTSISTEWVKNVLLSMMDWLKWSIQVLTLFAMGFWNTYVKNYYQKLQQQYILSKALSSPNGKELHTRSSVNERANTIRQEEPSYASGKQHSHLSNLRYPPSSLPSRPKRRVGIYSPHICDRIGVTLSWHYTLNTGFEFRSSAWYIYLPTVEYVVLALTDTLDRTNVFYQKYQKNKRRAALDRTRRQKLQQKKDAFSSANERHIAQHLDDDNDTNSVEAYSSDDESIQQSASLSRSTFQNNQVVMDWLREKNGLLGVTCSKTERLEPPFHSCSAMISFSGFYYYPKGTIRQLSNIITVATQALTARSILLDSHSGSGMESTTRHTSTYHLVGAKKDENVLDGKEAGKEDISSKITSSTVDTYEEDDESDSSSVHVSPQAVDVKIGA